MSLEKKKKGKLKKPEKCPVCKEVITEIKEKNIPDEYWNKKNYSLKKQCDGHYFYSYEEKIHEKIWEEKK
jgi:hypothetical protein